MKKHPDIREPQTGPYFIYQRIVKDSQTLRSETEHFLYFYAQTRMTFIVCPRFPPGWLHKLAAFSLFSPFSLEVQTLLFKWVLKLPVCMVPVQPAALEDVCDPNESAMSLNCKAKSPSQITKHAELRWWDQSHVDLHVGDFGVVFLPKLLFDNFTSMRFDHGSWCGEKHSAVVQCDRLYWRLRDDRESWEQIVVVCLERMRLRLCLLLIL